MGADPPLFPRSQAGSALPRMPSTPPPPPAAPSTGAPPRGRFIELIGRLGKLIGIGSTILLTPVMVVQTWKVAEELRWIYDHRAGDPVGTKHTDMFGCTWEKVDPDTWVTHNYRMFRDCGTPTDG